jgi:hypothetical protein
MFGSSVKEGSLIGVQSQAGCFDGFLLSGRFVHYSPELVPLRTMTALAPFPLADICAVSQSSRSYS